VAVGAVGADQVVIRAHHRGGADDRRLLADRQVQEAAGLGLLILAPGLLLEAADQRHRLEQLAAGGLVGKRVCGRPFAIAGHVGLCCLGALLRHRRSR